MKHIFRYKNIVLAALLGIVFTQCYKEEHFSFPGPYDNKEVNLPDTLPFPFDATRNAGVWLMKDGVPDFGKILFKGYTDFHPMGDTLSWVQGPDGMEMIRHYNYYPLSDNDHFAGDKNNYRYNWAISKYFVPIGKGKSFYFYTKVTFGTMSATAVGLELGYSESNRANFLFGMDGASTAGEPKFFIDLYGTTVSVRTELGWPTIPQVLIPGVPAELEVVIVDELFYMKVNDILVFRFTLPHEELYYYTPKIRPWRNFVTVHEAYIESDDMFTVNYAMHEGENGYRRIQAPALAKAKNGDILLFAEGRSNPVDAYQRVLQNTRAVGDCDIILRKSSDSGESWGDISVLAGQGEDITYRTPQTVVTESGKIILQYSSINSTFINNSYEYDASSQRVYQIFSTDNGQSWSTPEDITSSLRVDDAFISSNAGHGIQITKGGNKNRILMPLTYSTNSIRVAISDDEGANWRLSEKINRNNVQYGSIVELADGRLMMIMGHTSNTPRNKLISYSEDGGETWTAPVNISSDVNTGDYGQLYPGVVVKGINGELFFINSTSRETDSETKYSPIYPISPVMYISSDNGDSFGQSKTLSDRKFYFNYNVPFGFMDAVVLNDGTVFIVGEGGVEGPQEGIVIYKK